MASSDLQSSNSEGSPDTYLTMPVDSEDNPPPFPRDSNSPEPAIDPALYSTPLFGINPATETPYEYPSPSPFEAQGPAIPVAVPAPTPARQPSTRRRRTTTRQASPPIRRSTIRQSSPPARQSAADNDYKTTDRHRETSKQLHTQYRGNEIDKARALHGMVPDAHRSQGTIKLGGTKERTRAMDDAMSYIAYLEEVNAEFEGESHELRRRLGVWETDY